MKEQLLADVESLTAALKALPPSAAIDRAVYQSERLHLAVRSSHSEATRFAAFTLNKIVRDLGDEMPAAVGEKLTSVRAGLEATGIDLHK